MYDCMYVCYLMSMAISIHIHKHLQTASSHGDICMWYVKTTYKSQYEAKGLHAYKFVLVLDTLHSKIPYHNTGYNAVRMVTHIYTHRSMHINSVDKNDFTCKGHAHPCTYHMHTTRKHAHPQASTHIV